MCGARRSLPPAGPYSHVQDCAHAVAAPRPLTPSSLQSGRSSRINGVQAVVLKVGERSVEGEHSQGGETSIGSAEHSDGLGAAGTVSSFGGGNAAVIIGGARESVADYPLLTCDGVCVGLVGPEGSATYVVQVRPRPPRLCCTCFDPNNRWSCRDRRDLPLWNSRRSRCLAARSCRSCLGVWAWRGMTPEYPLN